MAWKPQNGSHHQTANANGSPLVFFIAEGRETVGFARLFADFRERPHTPFRPPFRARFHSLPVVILSCSAVPLVKSAPADFSSFKFSGLPRTDQADLRIGSEPTLGITNNFTEQWGWHNTGQSFGVAVDPHAPGHWKYVH